MARVVYNSQTQPGVPVAEVLPNPFIAEMRSLFADIEEGIPWTQTSPTLQSGLQVCTKSEEDLLASCGALFDLPSPETDFCELALRYRESVIARFLSELPFPVFRLRWMKLMPKSCYSLHRDPTLRLHIPLVTNPHAHFVFSDHGIYHLEPGGAYVVDTRLEHSFFNGGDQARIHLVGVIPEMPPLTTPRAHELR